MSTMVAASTYLTGRKVRAMLRQPGYVAVTLAQPVIWLLLFGQLFKRVVEIPGFSTSSYITYLTPGVVVMTALFSNGWSGMGHIVDIERVMDRFLVSPVRRGSIIVGGLGYQAILTLIQSLIIIGLGILVGARFHGEIAGLAAFLVCVVLLGSAFASFSDAVALLARKQESLIAMTTFLVLPLSFLSSSFMPANLLPGWIQWVARFNPVNWTVEVGHETPAPGVDWTLVLTRVVLLLALALVCAWLSARAFRAYQRSV